MMPLEATSIKASILSQACLWLKRLGTAGFLFFLLKGMLWLLLPALLTFFGFSN